MANENHVTGAGGSGGQGAGAADRGNQDPTQDAVVPAQTGSGDQESGAGYGNNAGVQGEQVDDTAEKQA